MKILVTGARGFVGTALCSALRVRGTEFVATVRTRPDSGQVAVGDIGSNTDWRSALERCTTVVHLAARVHVMADTEQDPLAAYREVNVAGTLNLARQAVAAGVKRFVFVSSVKVNGERTTATPFTAADLPAPLDPYGQSKWEAETALQALGNDTGIEIVIVRPPLVYGPGVKANFLNLLKLVQLGLPLPFGSAQGRRSMVALDSLVDLLIVCCEHPNAPGGTFLVSDGADLTVRDLVQAMASAMNKRILLLPIPPRLMQGVANMLGKGAIADRLLGSLQVDIAKTCERLEWSPIITPQAAVNQTVAHFLAFKDEQIK